VRPDPSARLEPSQVVVALALALALTTGYITLFRYGQGVSHDSSSYFRNNAKYKEFAWAHTSTGNAVNTLDVSAISGCFANPAGATCAHYRSPDSTLICTAAGPCIGTVRGGNGGALTGQQKADLARWYGTSWTSPFALQRPRRRITGTTSTLRRRVSILLEPTTRLNKLSSPFFRNFHEDLGLTISDLWQSEICRRKLARNCLRSYVVACYDHVYAG